MLDFDAEPRTNRFAQRPVDANAPAKRGCEFSGQSSEYLVAHQLDGALVVAQGVIEGELVFVQPELVTPLQARLEILCHLDQLEHNLGGLDGPVVVLAHRRVETLGEPCAVHHISPKPDLDLVAEEPFEGCCRQVLFGQLAHLGEELLVDDAEIGMCDSRLGEDVLHAARDDCPRDDLADLEVQLVSL